MDILYEACKRIIATKETFVKFHANSFYELVLGKLEQIDQYEGNAAKLSQILDSDGYAYFDLRYYLAHSFEDKFNVDGEKIKLSVIFREMEDSFPEDYKYFEPMTSIGNKLINITPINYSPAKLLKKGTATLVYDATEILSDFLNELEKVFKKNKIKFKVEFESHIGLGHNLGSVEGNINDLPIKRTVQHPYKDDFSELEKDCRHYRESWVGIYFKR